MPLPQLRRVRWGVRFGLTLGVAASVAANILHARSNPISEMIAAWPSLALLLTVELISRVPVHRRSLAVVRMGATAAISSIAAWVSYWHMVGVAARYGETGASPYLLPISVDGLVIVASVSLVELNGRIRAIESATAVVTAVTDPCDTAAPPVTGVVSDTPKPTVTPPAAPPAKKARPVTVTESKPAPAKRQPAKRSPAKAASKPADASIGATRVRYWHGQLPDATDDVIADKAGVTVEVVKEHRPINGHAVTVGQ